MVDSSPDHRVGIRVLATGFRFFLEGRLGIPRQLQDLPLANVGQSP